MQEMISFLSLRYIFIGVAAGFNSGFLGIGAAAVVIPAAMFLAMISNIPLASVSFR